MTDSVFLGDLSWPEAETRIAAGAVMFVPLGATEQHGRHMPLNVDAVLPTAIAERVARRAGGLVIPTIPYGNRSQPRSGGGSRFPGTINLSAQTFSLVVRDVICELFRHGARKIVVLNGHYENIWPSIEGIELAIEALRSAGTDGLKLVRVDHWELISADTLARIFPSGYPGIELEHASVIETSMMLALNPKAVHLAEALNDGPARFKPYDCYPEPPAEVPASGVLSLTEGSSAEKGVWLFGEIEERLLQIVQQEFQ